MILILGILVGNLNFKTIKAETQVTGIITSDTTWTKTNSPYSLTGPILVNQGVTLTLEAGVIVEGGKYIQVEGTFRAQGTSQDLIYLDHTEIKFMPTSSKWYEHTSIEMSLIPHPSLHVHPQDI